MEKLIMLLDIYEEEVVGVHSVGDKITDKEVARIISKQFGFIKWLVDNDKIKKEGGICPRKNLVQETIIEDRETHKAIGWENKYTEEEQLLMYLSIQDNPINYLISYLK